jgi:hypothetical protein
MIQIRETTRNIPFYRPVPLTNLPLIFHREHLFPYTSYGDTDSEPASRPFRMVVLENASLRIEVAPELGGRVYSLFDKRIGQEILFSNPVVKPVRILPIWAFISGGIEFNFPIAHSPTSVAEVGCTTGREGDYGFIRVGEREARTGMEWVVELGLVGDFPVLVQRTALRNQTSTAHPWMCWTVCAVRSTTETEFIHSPHRVLLHDDRVVEADWPGKGLNWDRSYKQMTALFWKPGGAATFGAFHHDHGFGTMHAADPAQLPGKKLWTYGHGAHRAWGQGTTDGGLSYCEIESGPLLDQSQKPLFPAGTERRFTEFWLPVRARAECDAVKLPEFNLPEWREPWLGSKHSSWQTEWENFREKEGPLPSSPVPTGIALEAALRRELASGNSQAAEPLALWLAFNGRHAEALPLVANGGATGRRIAGLIYWKALNDPEAALPHVETGPLHDPIALTELDELYVTLGLHDRRTALLRAAPSHPRVIERRADLALANANPAETIRLLSETKWQREHQRYVRTELWRKAQAALGNPGAAVPEFLNEDNLAQFGAYWSE